MTVPTTGIVLLLGGLGVCPCPSETFLVEKELKNIKSSSFLIWETLLFYPGVTECIFNPLLVGWMSAEYPQCARSCPGCGGYLHKSRMAPVLKQFKI